MTNQLNNLMANLLAILILSVAMQAQTSGFTYQGRFNDSTVVQPTNGTYSMQFALFDAASGGGQVGATVSNAAVQVTNGIFTVNLDFGANSFDGPQRFLNISVFNTATSAFVSLSPRQAVASAPYSIRSLIATTATNALNLGGVAANQFIQEGDLRLTDARPSSSVNFSVAQLSGVVPIANGGTGSATQNFVDLSTTQSNIAGNKTFTGTVSANTVNATTGYNIGGNRVLSTPGNSNLLLGSDISQSGANNSVFGVGAGRATIGTNNAFFGNRAGDGNSTGFSNSFFGDNAGRGNTTGNNNTVIGRDANLGGNLSYATAIGSQAVVSSSNTIQLGRANGQDQVLTPGQISAPGGIGLGFSSIRLALPNDANHSIQYESDINGIRFTAFGGFRWLRSNGNLLRMELQSDADLFIGGSYLNFSDGRYKTNVQTFGNALDAIRRLRGVTFNWKPEQDKSPDTQIGFIAQEVEAVLPELVSTDKEGYKSVSYSNAVPVLVEAIKDQQTQIDAQKKEIEELKAKNEENSELGKRVEVQHNQLKELKKIVCAMNPIASPCNK